MENLIAQAPGTFRPPFAELNEMQTYARRLLPLKLPLWKPLCLVTLALASFALVLGTAPTWDIPARSLAPAGFSTEAVPSNDPTEIARPNSASGVSLWIAVRPDVALTYGGPASFEDVKSMSARPENAERWMHPPLGKEYLLTRTLGLKVWFLGEDAGKHIPDDCQIRLRLQNQVSSPRSCGEVKSEGDSPVGFEFSSPLRPGVSRIEILVSIEEKSGSIGLALMARTFQTADGTQWLEPFAGPKRVSHLEAYRRWGHSSPWSLGLFLVVLLLTCVIVAALFSTPSFANSRSALALLTLSILWFIGVTLAIRPLSGHDETAHADLFHMALLAEKGSDMDAKEHDARRRQFYDQMHELFLRHDFTRLHEVYLPPRGSCPHMVIGHCGYDENRKEIWYYRLPWKIVPQKVALNLHANHLLWLGRLLNLGLVVCTLLFVASFFGTGISAATALCMTMLGAFAGHVASVTNDTANFCFGFSVAAAACAILTVDKLGNRHWIGLGLLTLLAVPIAYLDKAGLAAVLSPAVFALALLLRRVARLESKGIHAKGYILLFSFAASVAVILFFLRGLLARFLKPTLTSLSASFTEAGEYLQTVGSLETTQALTALSVHARSHFGGYLWGRVDYPFWYFFFFVLCVAGAIFYRKPGFRLGFVERGFWTRLILVGSVQIVLLSLLSIVLEAASARVFSLDHSIRDTFLKARIGSPLLGAIWLPVLLWAHERPKESATTLGLIVLFLMAYFIGPLCWAH